MSSENKYIVFAMALMMSVTLFGASGAAAVDRTVLDADHVSETVGDEGIYEELAADARGNISQQIDGSLSDQANEIPLGITLNFDGETIATEAVTESFFADEFNRNFAQFITFLETDSNKLELWINLTPVRESVVEQFTAEGVTVDIVTLAQETEFQSEHTDIKITDKMVAEMNTDEAGYQSVRIEIRSQGLQDVPVELDESGSVIIDTVTLAQESNYESTDGNIEVTDAMIKDLNEGANGYEEVRLDVREQVRKMLPSDATEKQVDQALKDANVDMKEDAAGQVQVNYGNEVSDATLQDIIALQNTAIDGLTDPDLDSFDEYKSQRTADETTLEASLGDEIETALQEVNEEAKEDSTEQAQANYGNEVSDATLQDIIALQNTAIDGLTDPDLDSFKKYETQRDSSEENLEASLAAEIRDDIREQMNQDSEDRINLSEEFDEDSDEIATLQSGVSLVSLLAFALPVLFLGLIGVTYALTRSISRTALTTGYTLIVAGIMGVVANLVVKGPVLNAIDLSIGEQEAAQAGFADAFVGVFESLFSTLVTQSAVLIVAGICLAGIVHADRRGYFKSVRNDSDVDGTNEIPEESD